MTDLRKLAEDAAPGERWWGAEEWLDILESAGVVCGEETAAFIGAASPAVVLNLLNFIADLSLMTPYKITGEALTPTQLRDLIEQIARDAEELLKGGA